MKMTSVPTPTETNCYVWQHAWKAIDDAVRQIDVPYLDRAWVVAQRIIEAQASTYRPEVSETVALAMAWEDFEIACRGSGQPGIGGAIFHMWSRVPSNHDKVLHKALTEGFKRAVAATSPDVLRYPATARSTPIATLAKGFGRAEVAALDEDKWRGTPSPVHASFGGPAPAIADENLDTVGRPVFKFSILDGGRSASKDGEPNVKIPAPRKPRK